jgi:hypothetical protein
MKTNLSQQTTATTTATALLLTILGASVTVGFSQTVGAPSPAKARAGNAAVGVAAQAPAERPPEPEPAEVNQHIETILKDAGKHTGDAVKATLKSARAMADFQFNSGARSSSRSLAVLTSSTDPQKTDDIEEDLSVMARILQKAARSLKDDDRVMGIPVYNFDSTVFGTASGARNIYIEGHGAVFLFSVGYPLVGPRDDHDGDGAEAKQESEWDETLQEMYGRGRGSGDSELILSPRVSSNKAEAYDERKVDGLKTAVLDALKKNAHNIRALRPEEFVTVVVQGGDATEGMVRVTASNSATGAGAGAGAATAGGNRTDRVRKEVRLNVDSSSGRKPGWKGESVMNIRVSKTDIDAYTAGKLSDDEFRKKASVLTYLRRSEPTPRPRR